MADAPTLSPEVSRSVLALARTLVATARSWAPYPPEHPAVRGSLDRLRVAIREANGGHVFSFGVTPDTLIVARIPVEGREAATIGEAARWLHDRDVLEIAFPGDVSVLVYDALRSNRVYREGLPSDRITSIMGKKDDPAFNQKRLRRFINLLGLFPIGTLVRLNTDAIGVVTHEDPSDPFRPEVKVIQDREGHHLEESMLVNTWEPDGRGDFIWAVVEAVDPDAAGIDPLKHI